jgi:hypothetical protein
MGRVRRLVQVKIGLSMGLLLGLSFTVARAQTFETLNGYLKDATDLAGEVCLAIPTRPGAVLEQYLVTPRCTALFMGR